MALAERASHVSAARKGNGVSQRRAAAILETAATLFVEHGSSVTLDAIASGASSSKATIYGNFGDKRGLFIVAIEARIDETTHEFEGVIQSIRIPAPAEGAKGAVTSLVDFGIEWFSHGARPDVMRLQRLILAEAEEHPELMAHWLKRTGWAFRQLGERLSEFDRAGLLRVPDPGRSAQQLALLIGGEAWMRVNLFNDHDLSGLGEALDANVELFVRGHSKEEGR